jgi:AraC-like DNA-binding protein
MSQFVSIGMSTASGPLIRMHSHEDTWEILFYTGGTGVVVVGAERIPFAPGTIVFMPRGVEHAERGNDIFACIYLHFRNFSCRPGHVPQYQDDASASAESIARMLNREYHLKQPNWQRVTQELLDVLLLYFRRWDHTRPPSPMVEELRAILVDNLHDPDFDVASALERMPACAEHVRRVFARETGRTPLQYLLDLRIDEARRLLASNTLNVKQVAHRVGLTDPFYFSRIFRKSTGQSPRDYARKMSE